jgi:hypothetical protein
MSKEQPSPDFDKLVDEIQNHGDKLRVRHLAKLVHSLTIPTVILLFSAGVSVVVFVFGCGVWWEKRFPPEPNPSVSGLSPVARQKPQGTPSIRAIPYKGQPEWYSNHVHWLEQEGERDKKAPSLTQAYAIGESEYPVLAASSAFAVKLNVPGGYTISSNSAFRIRSSDGRTFLEPLDPTPTDENFQGLQVQAPECDKADGVVILFRVESLKPGLSMRVEDIVKAKLD